MNPLSRRMKIVIAFFVLVIGGYVLARSGLPSRAIPPDFDEARSQSAAIAEQIVALSNRISTDLGVVGKLEQEGRTQEAIALAEELLARAADVKQQATDLTGQLEKMTASVVNMKSPEARAAALEAVTDRLTVVSRLVSYSDYLAKLLGALQNRLAGLPTGDVRIPALIEQINGEVTAISNFDRLASEAMQRFDEAVKQ